MTAAKKNRNVATPTKFYAVVTDTYDNVAIVGPFLTKEQAVASIAYDIENDVIDGLRLGDECEKDISVQILEVVSDTFYDVVKAGIKLEERK